MFLIVFLKLVMKYAFCKKKTHINNIIFGRNLSFTIYLQNIKRYCNLVVYVVLYNIGEERTNIQYVYNFARRKEY